MVVIYLHHPLLRQYLVERKEKPFEKCRKLVVCTEWLSESNFRGYFIPRIQGCIQEVVAMKVNVMDLFSRN